MQNMQHYVDILARRVYNKSNKMMRGGDKNETVPYRIKK